MSHNYRFLLFLLLSVLFAACTPDHPHRDVMQDGTYEGFGEGRGGIIRISVGVREHKLASALVLAQSESVFAQPYIDDMIGRIIEAQSAEVDAISGATQTSNGVKSAMRMAIDKAYGRSIVSELYADTQADVVVIGAGGTGLSAAIEAALQGAGVIVLEKREFIGGNTNSSTGGINGTETSFQKALGIEDSKELFFSDIMKGGHYLNDSSPVRTLVENAPSTLDWIAGMGVDLSDVGLMGGSSVKRTHRPKGGLAIGPHLIKVLFDEAVGKGVEIRTGNTVLDVLMSSDGRACGVRVGQSGGPDYTIRAKAVIIATGGFGANLSAELYQMEKIQTHPTVDVRISLMITEAALSRSIQRYNGFQSSGEDADFYRSSVQMPVPLTKAPYYAVEVKPAIHHTMGGIHIDSRTRVLDMQGRPVEGLFACDEVTGGVYGGNRLGGNGVADIVVFGRIAGREAANL